jgi:hypothetical protein
VAMTSRIKILGRMDVVEKNVSRKAGPNIKLTCTRWRKKLNCVIDLTTTLLITAPVLMCAGAGLFFFQAGFSA